MTEHDANVPTIDISAFRSGTPQERRALGDAVDHTCRTVGFFKIAGHGISPDLVERMETVTTAFFALPTDDKLALVSPAAEVNRGYAPLGSEALSYSVGLETPPDLFEAFNVGVQNHTIDPDGLPEHHAVLYHENIWPTGLDGFRTTWEEYLVAMTGLAQEMLRIFAFALHLDEGYFADRAVQSPDVFRAINYERASGSPDPQPGQMRLGAHSDYGTCTILHADPVPGLQFLDADDAWSDIVPTPGTFVVNLGDMLAAWTNDHWRSTLHRVVPPAAEDGPARRRSYAYFHEADTDAMIEPLSSCIDSATPAKYEPMTAGDHLHAKIVSPRRMAVAETTSTTADRIDSLLP